MAEGGAQGQRLAVVLAQGDTGDDAFTTLGVVTENIGNNQEGFITTAGDVRGINTTGTLQGETWSDGDAVYLSPTVAGGLTNVRPIAPDHSIRIGFVTYAHQNNGKIYVNIDAGDHLDRLHDVRIANLQNAQVLTYNSLSGVWENTTPTFLSLSGGTVNGNLTVNGRLSADTTASGLTNTITGNLSLIGTGSNQLNAAYSNTIALTGETSITIAGGPLNFNTSDFAYNSPAQATAHRTALGSGAVGDDVFTADTEAAVHTAIGLYPISTQEFLSGSGTIALPTGARYVSFDMIAGGGGGGSGPRGAAGTGRSGGTGGRGGCRVQLPPTPVSEFTWPVSYVVGTGGTGGAARTADSQSGVVGTDGGNTTITSNGFVFRATGGARGNGGLIGLNATGAGAIVTSTGIFGSPLFLVGQAGGVASSQTGSVLTPADTQGYHTSAGGAGGGISSANAVLAAGRASNVGSTTVYQILGGLAGVAGNELGKNGNTALISKTGTGGGGGIATAVTFAGNAGGNGALYGGGGGGGSASVNGENSGAGGNGAGGYIQITFWY